MSVLIIQLSELETLIFICFCLQWQVIDTAFSSFNITSPTLITEVTDVKMFLKSASLKLVMFSAKLTFQYSFNVLFLFLNIHKIFNILCTYCWCSRFSSADQLCSRLLWPSVIDFQFYPVDIVYTSYPFFVYRSCPFFVYTSCSFSMYILSMFSFFLKYGAGPRCLMPILLWIF